MKQCNECNEWKPLDNFYNYSKNKKRKRLKCKKCFLQYAQNSEKRQQYVRQYRQNNKEKIRKTMRVWALQKNYNMLIEEYDKLLKKQNNVCAICKEPETRTQNGKTTPLCVDHDHKTGEVRKLLCSRCNILIGLAKDSPEILKEVIKYIKEF